MGESNGWVRKKVTSQSYVESYPLPKKKLCLNVWLESPRRWEFLGVDVKTFEKTLTLWKNFDPLEKLWPFGKTLTLWKNFNHLWKTFNLVGSGLEATTKQSWSTQPPCPETPKGYPDRPLWRFIILWILVGYYQLKLRGECVLTQTNRTTEA